MSWKSRKGLVKEEYKNMKLFMTSDYDQYLKLRCKFLLNCYSDWFILQQGVYFNYYISQTKYGYDLHWSYGFYSASERQHVMSILDIIDIALFRAKLQKQQFRIFTKDINKWNKMSPIL